MLNRLEGPARLVIRICLGLFTAAVILLIQSFFWTGAAVSGSMRTIIVATALLAYFRPHLALLVLAVCVPLGQVGSRTLDSNMRGAEALVLAFLAGTLIRGWTLHQFRSVPSNLLQIVSFSFGLVVAASCVEQLWFAQLQRDFPGRFLQDVAFYASRRYLIAFDGLDMIFSAMLLLEGLALMLYVAHYCHSRLEFARQLVVMLIAGAVGAALVNLTFIGSQLLWHRALYPNLSFERWTVHIGDVNAAASYFALSAFVCVGMAWQIGERRSGWIIAGILTATAFWLTGSRTGLIAVGLVGLPAVLRTTIAKSRPSWKTIVTLLVGVGVFVLLFIQLFPHSFVNITATQAVTIRWLFLQTTWNMLHEQPLFGMGVGQYALWSAHFSPPAMVNYYNRENAHNYFAQIAGELGAVGFITFIAVLAWSLRADRSSKYPLPRFLAPLFAGVAVFIVTWLGGHPLLVPEVAYPFWLTLGIIPGALAISSRIPGYAVVGAMVLTVALAVSIAPRVHAKSARIDFTRVTYGLTDGRADGAARFFVAGGPSGLRIPVRARDATPDSPVMVDIFVDDRLATTLTFADDAWQDARPRLSHPSSTSPRKIDLRVREHNRVSRIEVGKWEIISAPDA